MPTQTLNGTPLFYSSEGAGEPLVLVHGSWAEQTTWDLVVPGLARSSRVVRYDRRGHGQSTAPPAQGTVHDDVADLAALIEDLGLAPANVCGNSYGACISLRLAAERPELVRRVAGHEPPMVGILAGDPSMRPMLEGLQSRIGSVVELLETGKNADAAELFVETVALGPGTWAQLPEPARATFIRNAETYLGETRDPDALVIDLDALGRFDRPVLLSQGDQSPSMFPAVIEKLNAALPQARRPVLAGAGHVPQLTHPDDFVKTLSSFLEGP
jgi:pimeloyl-ACP methyl ester carboxylesterase